MLSYAVGEKVSAADMALTYFEKRQKKEGKEFDFFRSVNTGGITAQAFRAAVEDGYCTEAQLPSDRSPKKDSKKTQIEESYDLITDELDRENETQRLAHARQAGRFMGTHPVCRPWGAQDFSKPADLGIVKSMYDILSVLDESKRLDPALALRNQVCKVRKPVSPKLTLESDNISAGFFHFGADRRLMNTIDEQLSGKNPISIAYNYNFATTQLSKVAQPVYHSSLVVGRRWNAKAGECEYLVRDSYGPDCKTTDANGSTIDRYNYPCEEGNFWVPRDALKERLLLIDYVKK